MPITNNLHERVFATAYDVSLENFQRKSYLEPEEKLMLAVLEDAIACFQKYAFARDRNGKVLFQEAEYWVQDSNSHWPFSFANVCEILGLAPDYLRQGLGQWKGAMLESRAKAKIYQLAPRNGKRKRSRARDRVRTLLPSLLLPTATRASRRPRSRYGVHGRTRAAPSG
jgi:hypothetical protein